MNINLDSIEKILEFCADNELVIKINFSSISCSSYLRTHRPDWIDPPIIITTRIPSSDEYKPDHEYDNGFKQFLYRDGSYDNFKRIKEIYFVEFLSYNFDYIYNDIETDYNKIYKKLFNDLSKNYENIKDAYFRRSKYDNFLNLWMNENLTDFHFINPMPYKIAKKIEPSLIIKNNNDH